MTDSTTTATTATNKPDLLDCDALMLSSYLLHHRFDGDAMATATFLLEATSTLPNAESISAQLLGTSNEKDNMNGSVARAVSTDTAAAAPTDFGNALARECAVSMTQPRGKFNMTVYEHGIRCVNAKNQVLSIVPSSVEHLVLFPKPEDCRATSKPSGGDMVLLTLVASDSTAFFNGKTLPQVCFQLAKEPPSSSETWLDTMCSSLSLEKHQVAIVPNPKFKATNNNTNGAYSFKSHDEGTTSSTTAGMPYVQCYHGVKDGVIFPMQQGLLFFKPPMFLHRSTLHSIACGRGSGASSRYVDLSIVLDNDENTRVEFTNIHREELVHLNDYIHSTLIPAMKRDALPQNHDNMQQEEEKEEAENDSTSLGKRKRVQRKASKEARQATKADMERTQDAEEDSEEDDDGWEGKEEEEESDDDDEDMEEEMAVDGNSKNDEDDEESEEEFFEEEASGSATESDDDDQL